MTIPTMGALAQPGRIDGIDVSAIQGRVDWDAVARAGFRFAAAKLSEGTAYTDPFGAANLRSAADAGLYTLAYGFARPSMGHPREQAQRLHTAAGESGARYVLDIESRPDAWTNEQLVAFAVEFADELRAIAGRPPVIYSYVSFLLALGKPLYTSSLANCPLWIAQYKSTTTPWAPAAIQQPIVPMPWTQWAMWQYSGDGGYRVPGVGVACDRNLFRGSEREFAAFFGVSPDDVPTLPALPDGEPILHPLSYDDPPDDAA
jgi:lysozyme